MRIYIKYFAPDGTETIESIDPRDDEASFGGEMYQEHRQFVTKLKRYTETFISQNTKGYPLWYDNMKINVDRVTLMTLCESLSRRTLYGKIQKEILNVIGFNVKQRNEPFQDWNKL